MITAKILTTAIFCFPLFTWGATIEIEVIRNSRLGSGVSQTPDLFYNDGESVELITTTSQVQVRVFGRNYTEDSQNRQRYGLLDSNHPRNWAKPGVMLRGGLRPATPGTPNHLPGRGEAPTEASYLSFTLTAPAGSMFTTAQVDLEGFDIGRNGNLWVGTNPDFIGTTEVSQIGKNKGRKTNLVLTVTPELGGGLLEFRLYGITGADEAEITNITVTGNLTTLTDIPEPATGLLLLGALAFGCRRSRRESFSL